MNSLPSVDFQVQHLKKVFNNHEGSMILFRPQEPLDYVSLMPFKLFALDVYKLLISRLEEDDTVIKLFFTYFDRKDCYQVMASSHNPMRGTGWRPSPLHEDEHLLDEETVRKLLNWYREHQFVPLVANSEEKFPLSELYTEDRVTPEILFKYLDLGCENHNTRMGIVYHCNPNPLIAIFGLTTKSDSKQFKIIKRRDDAFDCYYHEWSILVRNRCQTEQIMQTLYEQGVEPVIFED